MLEPTNNQELREVIKSAAQVIPVGAETKPSLSQVNATKLSTRKLSGIIEYEPSEFTFTARGGTPVKEIVSALEDQGQYLPFDPLLVETGATLGGTIAAGLNGPGRLRYGGIRDFILGVRFVDGQGRLLTMGGKVVKNAAGFDLPKFLVGSLGRFGVIAEATFKVFPKPAAERTLALDANTNVDAGDLLAQIPGTGLEPQALEYDPGNGIVFLRIGGPADALPALEQQVFSRRPGHALTDDEAAQLWSDLREFKWAHSGGTLIKLVCGLRRLEDIHGLATAFPNLRVRVGSAAESALISLPAGDDIRQFSTRLQELDIQALAIRGDCPLFPGRRHTTDVEEPIKNVLDPDNRFPRLD